MIVDSKNFKQVLMNFPKQIAKASKLGKNIKFSKIKRLLVCGMGGSALPGDFLKSLFYPLDFEISVNKDYSIPNYIDKSYLCVCISYSGNTEETLSMYKQLIQKKCNVVVITSGGEIKKLSKKNNTPLIIVPKGLQPRLAIAYQVLPVINLLINCGVIKYDLDVEVSKSLLVLNYDFETKAKKLSKKIKNKVILVYSSSNNYFVSEKWKISFNENTKTPSFFNICPEWNHNEINGFNNTKFKFSAFFLTDKRDNDRIKKRFKINEKLLTKKNVNVINVALEGRGKLSRIFFGILLGDWVSYELALLYNQDPESVPIIEQLKKELKK